MPVNRGSDNFLLEVALETTDIGGTSALTKSIDMSECDDAMFVVEVGTWNVADDLEVTILQDVQADLSSADVKVCKTQKIQTDAADGQRYCYEVKAEDLDTEGRGANTLLPFRYVGLKVEEADDTGPDSVTVSLLAFNLRKRYQNLAAYDAIDASS